MEAVTEFQALVVREMDAGGYASAIESRKIADLPDHEVLIRVDFSSLNYKDALSSIGNRGVTRQYPHTPGIDAVGRVVESRAPAFQAGDPVLVTGYDLGMNTPGGLGSYIRVPAEWVVPLAAGLTPEESMIIGTAGFTAAMCIDRMVAHGVTPESGEILVTGASGGVGSLAVAILAHLGFEVVAVSGKAEAQSFLQNLGAKAVMSRDEATDTSSRPLLKGRWAGVVDTVGGPILATAIKSSAYGGAVTCCGLVASPDLPTSVFPFILRGVTLFGIDSAGCPRPWRLRLWEKLAAEWKPRNLAQVAREIPLEAVAEAFPQLLQGRSRGRILVRVGR
jgi:acrylyl-CoA reductase (NADPH)